MVTQFCLVHTNELPSDYAARLGQTYNRQISKAHKKKIGQFFTPVSIARFMAGMSTVFGSQIRILDPGCGVAILSCALIEFLSINRKINKIELVVYETDKDLIFFTETALDYLKRWVSEKGYHLEYSIHPQDFVMDNNYSYKNFEKSYFQPNNLFDIVISNPPYFKLNARDHRVLVADHILGKQPNIYSVFIAVAATLLKFDGELIFVIPRSFTSGYYYTSFRKFLLEKLQLNQIHLFSSRRYPFQIDNVLQETMIMRASRVKNVNLSEHVDISNSVGLDDLQTAITKRNRLNKVVRFSSNQKIIHLPTSKNEDDIISIFDSWNKNLGDYKIKVSTGPVVDFRSLDFLIQEKNEFTVPLFWLNNVQKMRLDWPIENINNAKNRAQYIICNKESKSRLIKNQNCILIRRFSSKDDLSRLVATPLFKSNFSTYEYLGIENHLNYIYKKDAEFTDVEVYGISALLNSFIFDIYFRTFNGNTNVSSTELRTIPIPSYKKILEIGRKVISSKSKNQVTIDKIVNEAFDLQNKEI